MASILGEREPVLTFKCGGPGPHSPDSDRTLIVGGFAGKFCRACFEKKKEELGLYGVAEYAADKDPKFPGNGRATERR